ncbi:acyl-CoA dehydrogenase family protein [Persicobacter diffluens]|uniref:Acyl-CoA dehydrogenase n=1 Tax=Persicobacter diffluens TaxID=981 RepID=A0AAN5AJI7_9BACT|nr:acyl-CoA dehydrogenase [Persicobacter diffluens]
METLNKEKKAIKGGEFLISETSPQDVFTPEQWSEEQKMIAQTCTDFVEHEVYPKVEELDAMKDPELMPNLLDKSGELGLLGTSIPEQYGGFGMDFNTSMLIAEKVGAGYSFAVALSAHTGIGTLPILYYGNEDQKAKYLPKLATGEWKASYCLTEPDSGSDANSGKTKADLTLDGKHYLINGQKMWITNGGFADVFIVFAKIEDDKNLTAFIVEKGFGGVTMNEEEKKMGIKGSSTRQIFFNDCKVPVENMLSERENGFKIALNILNIGRIKLASATLGAAKGVIKNALNYSQERKQFGKSIAEFGAIKHKLGEMMARVYASEAATYRAGQNIDDAYDALVAGGMEEGEAKLKAVEEFAIECAMLKVHGSETLDFVVDEGVQVYGGMGYSADAPMERAYRDSRINRIFEGTNEINRMLTIDMLLKRAMKGKLDLMSPAMAVAKELTSIPDFGGDDDERVLAAEHKLIKNLKKAGLMIAGAAVQKLMATLKDEQEILMNLADMLIQVYALESAVLRTERIIESEGAGAAKVHIEMVKVYAHYAVDEATKAGKQAIYAFAEGDEMRMMLMGLKRYTKVQPHNLKVARRTIADYCLDKGDYPFN